MSLKMFTKIKILLQCVTVLKHLGNNICYCVLNFNAALMIQADLRDYELLIQKVMKEILLLDGILHLIQLYLNT